MKDLVPLFDYLAPQEAHQLRNMLSAEGLPSFIEGEQASSMMPHVGAVAGVRLLVRQDQLARAKQILSEARAAASSAQTPTWFCGRCQEVVEAGFDVCWSCGGLKENVEDPAVDISQLGTPEEETVAEDEVAVDIELDAANPYAAGALHAKVAEVDAAFNEALDAQLSRAWRAALMGIVFLPVLLSLYSLYLLITLPALTTWPAAANRRFWRTVYVDLLAILAWLFLAVFFLIS